MFDVPFLVCKVWRRVCHMVPWLKPPVGSVKLNVDGSALGNPGTSDGGILIRDFLG